MKIIGQSLEETKYGQHIINNSLLTLKNVTKYVILQVQQVMLPINAVLWCKFLENLIKIPAIRKISWQHAGCWFLLHFTNINKTKRLPNFTFFDSEIFIFPHCQTFLKTLLWIMIIKHKTTPLSTSKIIILNAIGYYIHAKIVTEYFPLYF